MGFRSSPIASDRGGKRKCNAGDSGPALGFRGDGVGVLPEKKKDRAGMRMILTSC